MTFRIPVERNYVKEKQQGILKSSEAKEHPLGENYVGTALNSSQKRESFASPKVNKNAPGNYFRSLNQTWVILTKFKQKIL